MQNTEDTIIQSAIHRFLRYGAIKTSMNEIAKDAGVSRQTLYDLFKGKDDLIRASIRSITDQNLSYIRHKLNSSSDLRVRLETYFEENVIKNFEMMRVSDDPQDLVTGHNAAGKAEIAVSRRKHEQLISEWFSPYASTIAASGHTVEGLAHFVVIITMAFKYEAADRNDLDELLSGLMTVVLSATGLREVSD